MKTNTANDTNIIHPELSYQITGILFKVHNEVGRFCREVQYGDLLETLLKEKRIKYEREKTLPIKGIKNQFTNKVDFVIEGSILIDIKAKPVITKVDYYQMNRYLEACGYKLGMIVNFRNTYLKPIRVIRANS
ncbi:MAG: GxxExxY protein [Parcubacteria group bacterium GW2011_GWA2_44_15]|nr:MAG: GxxExxY protein [Parcubacteria group bacterium GW2011_GWA2_44_15]